MTAMKMKSYLFIGVMFLMCQNLCAQIPQPARPRDFSSRTAIDSVSFQVTYSSRIRRVLHVESYSADLQILEIGSKHTRYYSRLAELSDSLYTNFKESANFGRDENGYVREETYEDIFINYPDQNKISVVTRYLKKSFVYEEERPELEWTISSETETILGYECTKATASFRGRTWYAWFTMDIPLNYGPWKLSGLPGLILKAEDADRYFTFEAVGIKQNVRKPIMMFDEKMQKCKRKEVLVLNDLRWKDSDFLLKLMSGQDVVTADPNSIANAIKNNPTPDVVIPQKELE